MRGITSTLINPLDKCRHIDLIKQVLSFEDATTILGIPLSSRLLVDRLIQAYSPKSNSRFIAPTKLLFPSQPAKVLKLQMNSSVEHSGNLQKVFDSPICEAWELEAKTSGTLFWHCEKTHEIWTLYGLPLDFNRVHFPEFNDLLWYLKFVQHVGNDILELVINIAQSIWFNRNQVWQGKTRHTASMIIHKASSLINEFQVPKFRPSTSTIKDPDLWINPKPPWKLKNTTI